MLAWVCLASTCGALQFAVWLSRAAAGRDARSVGDGNPGAANAWRAGGWRLGVAVLLLDFLKGALPVAGAHFGARLSGLALAGVAVAPVLGHAFSPFLRFRGGKALTVSFGAWAGLTLGHAPLVLGLFMLIFYTLLRSDAWATIFSQAGLLVHLLLLAPQPALLWTWAGIVLILLIKHGPALRQPPRLRPALVRAVARRLRRA